MKSAAANWSYAEGFHETTAVVDRARARADELGCTPVSPGVAAMLAFIAASTGARAAVEVGTGTGVSAMALLSGMGPQGVLTTIDIQREHQVAARDIFAQARIPTNRVRTIVGDAADVLPRLSDAAYDIVLIDADKLRVDAYLDHALRLLRVGGTLVVDNALWHGRVADPTKRDSETVALRTLGRRIRDDEHLVSALVPVGDGLLVATKRSS